MKNYLELLPPEIKVKIFSYLWDKNNNFINITKYIGCELLNYIYLISSTDDVKIKEDIAMCSIIRVNKLRNINNLNNLLTYLNKNLNNDVLDKLTDRILYSQNGLKFANGIFIVRNLNAQNWPTKLIQFCKSGSAWNIINNPILIAELKKHGLYNLKNMNGSIRFLLDNGIIGSADELMDEYCSMIPYSNKKFLITNYYYFNNMDSRKTLMKLMDRGGGLLDGGELTTLLYNVCVIKRDIELLNILKTQWSHKINQ
jgi:hypothetical protein